MSTEVADLIAAFRNGTMTLDQVAQKFRERRWPRSKPPRATTYIELAKRAEDDPDPYVPGSFDDVAAAFHRGDLTRAQYKALAEAAADSMRAEDRQRPGESSDSG
jgi:hypothetical protein